jgi:hypothetical protein
VAQELADHGATLEAAELVPAALVNFRDLDVRPHRPRDAGGPGRLSPAAEVVMAPRRTAGAQNAGGSGGGLRPDLLAAAIPLDHARNAEVPKGTVAVANNSAMRAVQEVRVSLPAYPQASAIAIWERATSDRGGAPDAAFHRRCCSARLTVRLLLYLTPRRRPCGRRISTRSESVRWPRSRPGLDSHDPLMGVGGERSVCVCKICFKFSVGIHTVIYFKFSLQL